MNEPKIITVPIESTFSTDRRETVQSMNEIVEEYPDRIWRVERGEKISNLNLFDTIQGWIVVEKVED